MGEYAKTYARIADLKKRKKELQQKVDELVEQIYDIDEEINDCDAYLLELHSIDNTDPADADELVRY